MALRTAPAEATRAQPTDAPRWVVVPAALGVAFMPFLRPSGPGNVSPVDVFIAASLVVGLLWLGARLDRIRFPYAIGLGLTMVGGAVGGLAGAFPGTSLIGVVQDLWLLLWCAALVNVGRTRAGLRTLLAAWSWASIAWAGLLVFAVLTGRSGLAGTGGVNGPRASLTFGDPNMAASYFTMSFLVIWATAVPRRRLVRYGAYALLLTALAMTGSNGGALSLAIGLVVAGLISLYRRWGLAPTIAVAGVAMILALPAGLALSHAGIQEKASGGPSWIANSVGRSNGSVDQRTQILQESLQLYLQGWPLGIGTSATKPYMTAQQDPYAREAHDDYMAAISEGGMIGGVGLLVLIGAVGVRARRLAGALPPGYDRIIPHPGALLGALAGLAVSGAYYQVLHFRHAWALFAVLAAVYLAGSDR
jgi:hypothetical protein